MLVDANILLYAVDETSAHHRLAHVWLEEALNGIRPVGLPWLSLWAFLRIATNPRALEQPLSATAAWGFVGAWLDAPATWIPGPTRRHREILGRLVEQADVRGKLVSDAVLAAICLEHGLTIVSADSDFARFPDLRRLNPVQP